MSSKLFVGNLSGNTSDLDLRSAFTPWGNVLDVTLMLDRATARCRGFGYVTMSSASECEASIAAVNHMQLHGRTIQVDHAGGLDEQQFRAGSNPQG